MEKLTVLLVIILMLSIFYMDLNRNVEVYICDKNGITRYVSVNEPSPFLSVGECRIESMKNKEYYSLKSKLRSSLR